MTARAHPIVEFVGLPGAGKSTIVRALRERLPPMQGPQLPRAGLSGSLGLLATGLPLILSLRPVELNDLHRLVKLLEAYSVYRNGLGGPLLLEQGLIQRLWSLLADRRTFGGHQLDAFVKALAAAAPDVIVWVTTGPEAAAARIRARPRGNSRYERQDEAVMVRNLAAAADLYDRLIELWRRHSAATILEVPGERPAAENAARLAALLQDRLPGLRGAA